MKYVIYHRVSGDKQDVAMQDKACMDYVLEKTKGKKYELEIFSDPDMRSGVKMKKRIGLMAMLNSLQRGHQVVLYKLDRLSRDIVEMVTIYRMIRDKKCKIHSLNDPDCDNEFIVGIMGAVAQKEKKDIGDRTRSAHALKKQKKERVGRFINYGYTLDTENLIWVKGRDREPTQKAGLLIEDPAEQKVIQHMCSLYDMGFSYRAICLRLAEQGYLNREDKVFKPMSIYRILLRTGRPAPYDPAQEEREFQDALL